MIKSFGVFLSVAAVAMATSASSVKKESVVELNPATIKLSDDTDEARADWIRLRIVSVNGQTGNYILASGHGPQEGYIGEINDIISYELGAVLNKLGVEQCSDIPTTGSETAEIDDDGETISLTATFSTGQKQIPSFYEDGGTQFEKRIVLSEEGEDYLLVELTCEDDLNTVYVLMPETDDNNRAREVYYQHVPSTGESRVDVHMTKSGSDPEKFVTRFHYDDDIARIWTIRVYNGKGSGEAVAIDTTTGLAHAIFLVGKEDDETGTYESVGDDYCINLATNSDGGGACTAASLAAEDPDEETPDIEGESYSYVINDIKDLVLGDI